LTSHLSCIIIKRLKNRESYLEKEKQSVGEKILTRSPKGWILRLLREKSDFRIIPLKHLNLIVRYSYLVVLCILEFS